MPSKEHEAMAREYLTEHLTDKESMLHGAASLEQLGYFGWLEQLKENEDEATVSADSVPSSTFFALHECDDRLIGMLDVRHRLNDFLSEYGGHIGYGVRPKSRGKGYAKEILLLGLVYCKEMGLSKVMVCCHKENVASSKVIVACGGQLEREFVYSDGKMVQVYWIDT